VSGLVHTFFLKWVVRTSLFGLPTQFALSIFVYLLFNLKTSFQIPDEMITCFLARENVALNILSPQIMLILSLGVPNIYIEMENF
jgi:hypothetical protein